MGEERLAGRLLVASPALHDENFRRAVVLLLDHGDDGALGVVLNRPSPAVLEEPLPPWRLMAAEPPVVFVGGPVALESAICLAEATEERGSDGWQPLFGRLGILLGFDPDEAGVPIERLRIFAGYAGWGPGQLEEEIAEGAWFVVAARADDALCADPVGLWRRVLRRQRGVLAGVANFPAELSVN